MALVISAVGTPLFRFWHHATTVSPLPSFLALVVHPSWRLPPSSLHLSRSHYRSNLRQSSHCSLSPFFAHESAASRPPRSRLSHMFVSIAFHRRYLYHPASSFASSSFLCLAPSYPILPGCILSFSWFFNSLSLYAHAASSYCVLALSFSVTIPVACFWSRSEIVDTVALVDTAAVAALPTLICV